MIQAALSDAEISAICAPLTQGAAQVRYLRIYIPTAARRTNIGSSVA